MALLAIACALAAAAAESAPGFRRTITINAGQVSGGPLVNFPFLFNTTYGDLRTTANGGQVTSASGYDIIFSTSPTCTTPIASCPGRLDHEIESYSPTTGQFIAWVRVPAIDNGTVFYLYYGDNTQSTSLENKAGVWDTSYKGVWHLKETPAGAVGEVKDSTSHANNGTGEVSPASLPTQTAGQIDGSLSFDGMLDRDVVVPHSASLQLPSAMTVSAWVRTLSSDGQARVIVAKWNTSGSGANYWLGKLNAVSFTFVVDGGQAVQIPLALVADGSFHHVVAVADAAQLRLYVDGVQRGTSTYSGTSGTGTSQLRIGRSPDVILQDWAGGIDEVRVSSVARSPGWIVTEYRNQVSPSTFYNVCDCVASNCASPLTVSQGAGTVTVTAPGTFELRFNAAMGGGIDQFYDLAEDPTRDLAGGATSGKSLFDDSLRSGATTYATEMSTSGSSVDLLEATPTRVRVRQEAFYQSAGGAVLPGLKGLGDYTVYPTGRVSFRWNERATAAVTYTDHDLSLYVHLQASGPLSSWKAYNQGSGLMPPSGPGTASFLLAQNEVAGARTDFLSTLASDWTIANGHLATATSTQWFTDIATESGSAWWEHLPGTSATIPAGAGPFSQQAGETWNLLTHFKPTSFVNQVDAAVLSRSADYRAPDSLSMVTGSGWFDPGEKTASPSDFFNESEAAYTLNVDPAAGLEFSMNGGGTPRFEPFFKIRQWRSPAPPSTIRLGGSTLTRNVDYRADVKPVARAHFAQDLVWHSTLESPATVNAPDVGQPGTTTANTFVPARYGNGFQVAAGSDYLSIPTTDFDMARGAVEFWYQPAYPSGDAGTYNIAGFYNTNADQFLLAKAGANLVFSIVNAGTTSTYTVPGANFSWRAGDWVHLRLEWDDSLPLASQQRVLINGVEPAHLAPTQDYTYSTPPPSNFIVGRQRIGGPNVFSPGIYDEVHVYAGSSTTPTPLAHGGLMASASEYLADPARNFTLGLGGVASLRQGRYLLLGADSGFRGLNIALSTAGAGVAAGALAWEYWNGTAWADLEAGTGFTDETISFTRTGAVYWTADPPSWSPYSVNGGPDLYYVRVHLASGSAYTTAPVESLIKTDILLLQYCGDITAAAQTFRLSAARNADLAITKSDGTSTATPGTPVTYTITVTNKGPEPVASVVVTDSVSPAGAILGASFSTLNGTYDSGTGNWAFSSALGVGQSAELTLSGTIDPLARVELRNTATGAPPADLVDPNPGNDSATDIDTLTPSVDVVLTKTAPATVGLGSLLTYTMDVTSAPSGASTVVLTDTLPPGVVFESVTPAGCSYDGSTRTVTCNLGSVASSAQVTLNVRPMAVGTFRNTAVVTSSEDPAGPNNTAFADTTVEISTIGVQFFTVTSTNKRNVLEWVNPTDADYDRTEIRWSNIGFPADETEGSQVYYGSDGGSGGRWKITHDTGDFSNGLTFYYAAFVHRTSTPSLSPGRFCTGRPFDSITGPVKWAFSTGATAVTPPTVGGAGVVAPSNDRVLYAMERGSGANGGEWPPSWRPIQLQDLVQSRSPVIPVTVGTANPVVYLADQQGNVYAVDAVQGGNASLLWGGAPRDLGLMVQAAPAGIFSAFDPTLTFDYLLVGTRDGSGGPNAFVALDPLDGTEKDRFDDSGAGIGIINGMAAVDYPARRVYFASRERGVGSNTLWCLEMSDSPVFTLRWALPLGDIDSSPVLANGRVYVGNDGTVYSIKALDGSDIRSYPHGDGQVKGFVFPDRSSSTGDVYFATENSVWGLSDSGGVMSKNFGVGLGSGVKPSAVLFVPGSHYLYVGGSNGKLYEIDVAMGTPGIPAMLGDGSAVVGAPSLDRVNNLVHVGTEAGIFYAVQVPLAATCVPAVSCTAASFGQPCYNSSPATECAVSYCHGAGICGP